MVQESTGKHMIQSVGSRIYIGDLQEAPGFWLWISSALIIAAIWEVKQQMEDLCLLTM